MSRNPLRTTRSRKIYLEHNGDGPWPCAFCPEQVLKIGVKTWDGNVHHLDEDVTNDDPSNLVMAHVICHQHQHPVSEEMKAQISAKLKGRPSPTKGMKFPSRSKPRRSSGPVPTTPRGGHLHTPEAKAKMSAFQKTRPRKPFTPEHCTNISKVLTGVPKSPEHRVNIAIAAKNRPKTRCDRCGGMYTSQWIGRHVC